MEAIIPKSSIGLFCKIMTAMNRMGDDLGIKIEHDRVTFIMINNSRSAFTKTELRVRGFFDRYSLIGHPDDHTRLPGLVECGVTMKYVMNALKKINKTAQLRICVDPFTNLFTIEHQCEDGVEKTFRVPVAETTVLEADYDKMEYPMVLTTTPPSLLGTLSNFRSENASDRNSSGKSEITFSVDHTNGRITIQSHVDGAGVEATQIVPLKKKPALTTSMSCNLEDMFSVEGILQPGIEMTFTLQDLKHFLNMCDESFGDVRIYLHQQGRPIIFSVRSEEDDISSDMLLATLNGRDHGGSQRSNGHVEHDSRATAEDEYRDGVKLETTTTTIVASHNDSSSVIMSPPFSGPNPTHDRQSRMDHMKQQQQQQQQQGHESSVDANGGSNNPFSHSSQYGMEGDSIYVGEAQRYVFAQSSYGSDDLEGDDDNMPMNKRRRY